LKDVTASSASAGQVANMENLLKYLNGHCRAQEAAKFGILAFRTVRERNMVTAVSAFSRGGYRRAGALLIIGLALIIESCGPEPEKTRDSSSSLVTAITNDASPATATGIAPVAVPTSVVSPTVSDADAADMQLDARGMNLPPCNVPQRARLPYFYRTKQLPDLELANEFTANMQSVGITFFDSRERTLLGGSERWVEASVSSKREALHIAVEYMDLNIDPGIPNGRNKAVRVCDEDGATLASYEPGVRLREAMRAMNNKTRK
jgi:hypothetical protein